jgi:hypothetical protein
MSKKRHYAGSLAGVCVIASALFAASQNFVPDKIFQGSDLSGRHKLGDDDWRADHSKITGTPKRESRGWLVLDHELQDAELSASFRCNGVCKTGILLRAETSADGMKGVYISLSDGDAAAYEVVLDPRGAETGRTNFPRGPGPCFAWPQRGPTERTS